MGELEPRRTLYVWVVDARYVEETGEGRISQRLRLTTSFVRGAADAAALLADRLEETAEPKPHSWQGPTR